jgi:hypothetical protein
VRLAAILGACVLATSAAAGPTTIRFALDARVEGCPDARALRAAVVRRLGRDPFADDAPDLLAARIAPAPRGLAGSVTLTDALGRSRGRWDVETDSDCVELASALVLALSIVLDPPEPAPPSAPPPPAPASTWAGAVGPLAAAGAAPTTTVGVVARVWRGRASRPVGGEVRVDLPRSEPFGGGRIRTFSITGAGSMCARHGPLGVCGLLGAGVLHARGEGFADDRSSTQPMIYAGPRLMAETPLFGAFFLTAGVDGLLSLWQTTLRVDGDVAWATPVFSAVAMLGLGARFDAGAGVP